VPNRIPQLVVFDLDGVLARHDTMSELIRRRLRSSAWRTVRGALPAIAWFALGSIPRARIRMSRAVGTVALSGLDGVSYEALAKSLGAELGSDPAWVLGNGVEAARRHLGAGDDVVVTTGTEETLSRAFLDAAGLADAKLNGTRLCFDGGRARYLHHNLGRNKVDGLADRRIDLFYTDSSLDLPVASLSDHTVLINPDLGLERAFRSRIQNLTVEQWP
jgi:phosphoserine phosphatase